MKGSGPVFFGTNNWAIDKNINISAKVLEMGHSYVRRLGKEVNLQHSRWNNLHLDNVLMMETTVKNSD